MFAHEMVPRDRLNHSDARAEWGNLCIFHHIDEFLTCGNRILGLIRPIPQANFSLLHIWGLKKDKRCHENKDTMNRSLMNGITINPKRLEIDF